MKKCCFVVLVSLLLLSLVAVKGFAEDRLLACIEYVGEGGSYQKLSLIVPQGESFIVSRSWPITANNIIRRNKQLFITSEKGESIYSVSGSGNLIEYCNLNYIFNVNSGFGLLSLTETNNLLLIGRSGGQSTAAILHRAEGGIFRLEECYLNGFSPSYPSAATIDANNNLYLLYGLSPSGWEICKVTPEGEQTIIDSEAGSNSPCTDALAINAKGDIYFGTYNSGQQIGTVLRIPNGGQREIVATGTELKYLYHFTLDTLGNLFIIRNISGQGYDIIKIDTTTSNITVVMAGLGNVHDLFALD